jgi:hypothetical protein
MLQKSESRNKSEPVKKLGNLEKLGLKDYLITALLNPRVGSAAGDELIRLYQSGHEIGLHGGRNHGAWMRHADSWDDKKLAQEIEYGLSRLSRLRILPVGFSSPGWCSPQRLPRLLNKYSFSYYADMKGQGLGESDIQQFEGITNIPTNILGEPGGVGYFESLVADGKSQEAMLDDFEWQLDRCEQLAVMYDHPGFVFPNHINTLSKMIGLAKSSGWKIVTMRQYLER